MQDYRIDVSVRSAYLADQSDPNQSRFAFAYTVTIRNRGRMTAQLLTRRWTITDGNERVQVVEGDGVVGQQPVLQPGGSFQYTSGALLETPVGTMHGVYRMRAEDGHPFEAEIPAFLLSVPGTTH
jgi:ApaG protein